MKHKKHDEASSIAVIHSARSNQPLVAVSTDVCDLHGYRWSATPMQYLEAAVEGAGVFPVLVPSLGNRLDFDYLLGSVDGVIITGSASNVHPLLYGGDGSEANGPYDRARDSTTFPLIKTAIEKGIPLLTICRGLQEMNVALGGNLATEIHELPGILDHRAPVSDSRDQRFAIRQNITLKPDGLLSKILGTDLAKVNSVHRQSIDQLGAQLEVEAVAEDGTVEAVSVRRASAFALGVQWHPEYWVKSDEHSARIFQAFGDAVRVHADERMNAV
ncbi:gamma-glutamyl-gamma-aminobutyrate hydrolase family protein [Labrys okinawensis]|uniref:gamma-glutamyl-gamma-aminobutyrate hydrolase family protein n=1 Tax=Labrys okinawensis TaxID=346911 RepID=UPI0039BD9085